MIRQSLDEIDSTLSSMEKDGIWEQVLPYDKAKKDNAYQMPNIGFFNDNQRDAVKGEKFMVLSSQVLSVVLRQSQF